MLYEITYECNDQLFVFYLSFMIFIKCNRLIIQRFVFYLSAMIL